MLLTNATTRLHRDLAAIGLTDDFDRVFSSAELGAAKPDHRCFELVLDRLGVGRTAPPRPINRAFNKSNRPEILGEATN